ncbi:resistance to inhibitors of cholinesterase protein 3-like [Saccostrea echinata]|uniref:resistance to inhibitors of cholinesterase protein 3-like n=1 Tax=Saccostrea echinata TaxID=191078 RepID=UPI002A8400F2|nr:resistance to inhibitors of cholinesterase protein 3-like [Saccostrea echinata]
MALISGMSDVRVIITVVAIGGCLLTLYPKVFAPIVMNLFGGRTKDRGVHNNQPKMPPRAHHPRGPGGGNEGNPRPTGMPPNMDAEIERHMRQGPHPGMRHAAEMNKQQSKTSSGRGGMMGMVLPVYAVGIIGYLIYTLVKVFNKKSKGEYDKKPGYGRVKNKTPNTSEESSVVEEASLSDLKESSAKLSELENLLAKADDKNISADEMRALQTRLEETEKQMARILKAMQTVSSKVTDVIESKEENVDSDDKVNSDSEERSSQQGEEIEEESEHAEDQKESKTPKEKDKEEEVILLDGQKDKDSEEESGVRQRKVQVEEKDN